MKIAVTYDESGNVFQHFGKTEQFLIVDIHDGNVASSQIMYTNGISHGTLADFLSTVGVESVICGGIGAGAMEHLSGVGIEIYGGVTGSANDAVRDFIAGKITEQDEPNCSHHEEGHSCGGHNEGGCGHHEEGHGCCVHHEGGCGHHGEGQGCGGNHGCGC